MKIKGILMDAHCHLDGSLSIKTVKQLALLQNIALPQNFEKMLSVSDECADLNEYLSKFAFPLSLLQSAEAIELAVKNLCEEFKEKSKNRLLSSLQQQTIQQLLFSVRKLRNISGLNLIRL